MRVNFNDLTNMLEKVNLRRRSLGKTKLAISYISRRRRLYYLVYDDGGNNISIGCTAREMYKLLDCMNELQRRDGPGDDAHPDDYENW